MSYTQLGDRARDATTQERKEVELRSLMPKRHGGGGGEVSSSPPLPPSILAGIASKAGLSQAMSCMVTSRVVYCFIPPPVGPPNTSSDPSHATVGPCLSQCRESCSTCSQHCPSLAGDRRWLWTAPPSSALQDRKTASESSAHPGERSSAKIPGALLKSRARSAANGHSLHTALLSDNWGPLKDLHWDQCCCSLALW